MLVPAERHPLEQHLLAELATLRRGASRDLDAPVRPGSALTVRQAAELFWAQCESRQVDLAAIWMQTQGRGFYTISSSGHEGNAAVAAALRPDDPALLHYRSGGFYCARARQLPDADPVTDILRGMAASVHEPIAGGRHKVFGNAAAGRHPADLDDRLAPAPGGRAGLRAGPGQADRGAHPVPG